MNNESPMELHCIVILSCVYPPHMSMWVHMSDVGSFFVRLGLVESERAERVEKSYPLPLCVHGWEDRLMDGPG